MGFQQFFPDRQPEAGSTLGNLEKPLKMNGMSNRIRAGHNTDLGFLEISNVSPDFHNVEDFCRLNGLRLEDWGKVGF